MIDKKESWTISYKQIGIVVITFLLGFIVALLVSNSQSASTTNFTTTELIGFVLSVILSGASIVLAITAIALGKSSEYAVISRSDESIRLQTEVFTKTTDALHSIKASTDVTEKRIEDIISGRAGDISRQIAEIASDESAGNIDIKELEEKIKKSIVSTLEKGETEEDRKEREIRRAEYQKRREEYLKYHNKLLYAFANKDNTKVLKLGHGIPTSTEKEDFSHYDAVFENNGSRIAVSTLEPSGEKSFRGMDTIINGLVLPLQENNINKLYLVLFCHNEDDEVVEMAKKSLSLIKEDLASRIVISAVQYCDVDTWVEAQEL